MPIRTQAFMVILALAGTTAAKAGDPAVSTLPIFQHKGVVLDLIYHGHLADRFQTANLYASEIDPAFERPTYLGLFYDHTTASPDNVAQMSPCFLEASGKIYMYTNIGPRLHQKIALAVAEAGSDRR